MSGEKIVYEPSQTTHWRNLFKSKTMLLGSHNLNEGEEIVCDIAGVSISTIKNQSGKDETVPVLTFNNAPPMVLNITNTRMIASLYGENYDAWVGCKIQVFATKVKAFGQVQMALRVRQKRPSEGVDLTGYQESLRACKTMDDLKAAFMAIPKHLQRNLSGLKDEMKGIIDAQA